MNMGFGRRRRGSARGKHPYLIRPHHPYLLDDEEGLGEEEGAGEGQGGNIQSVLTRDERRHLRELMRHTPSTYFEY